MASSREEGDAQPAQSSEEDAESTGEVTSPINDEHGGGDQHTFAWPSPFPDERMEKVREFKESQRSLLEELNQLDAPAAGLRDGQTFQIPVPTGPDAWIMLHGAASWLQSCELVVHGPARLESKHQGLDAVIPLPGAAHPRILQTFKWNELLSKDAVEAYVQIDKVLVRTAFRCSGYACGHVIKKKGGRRRDQRAKKDGQCSDVPSSAVDAATAPSSSDPPASEAAGAVQGTAPERGNAHGMWGGFSPTSSLRYVALGEH